ncbi:MAG: FkbM family methyltransferase [Candidatus Eremiobacteraeota bacterium]|nr:FkbM family methyltransferase [Candidatus Eremiobacteraeota bacterium]
MTGETWLRSVIAPAGGFFIDVGANIGDWTYDLQRQIARSDAQFAAYEPSRSAFAQLRDRFDGDGRVVVLDMALGDHPGTMRFFEERNAGKGSSFVPGFMHTAGDDRTVSVTTLDAEIDRLGWPRVDFVKIDAEGYDFRVIRGAYNSLKSHRIAFVQFEYNRSWQLAGDTLFGAFSFLKEAGYETYLLKREGLFMLNYKLYEEYFEYSNYVAVSPERAPLIARFIKGTI